jgi:hypothetical protein
MKRCNHELCRREASAGSEYCNECQWWPHQVRECSGCDIDPDIILMRRPGRKKGEWIVHFPEQDIKVMAAGKFDAIKTAMSYLHADIRGDPQTHKTGGRRR